MGNFCSREWVNQKNELTNRMSEAKNELWYNNVIKIIKQRKIRLGDKLNIKKHQIRKMQGYEIMNEFYLDFEYKTGVQNQQLKNISKFLIEGRKIQDKNQIESSQSMIGGKNQIVFSQQLYTYGDFCNFILLQFNQDQTDLNKIIKQFKKKINIKNALKYQPQSTNIKSYFITSTKLFVNNLIKFISHQLKIQHDKKTVLFRHQNIQQFFYNTLFKYQDFYQQIKSYYNYYPKILLLNQQCFIQNPIFSLDINTLNLYNKQQEININMIPYKKSIQKLQQINNFKQPIKKLNVLYQTINMIQSQILQFYSNPQYSIELSQRLTIQTLQDILRYIMSKIKNIQMHIQMVNDFIKPNLKRHPKGSFLLLYLSVLKIQNIITIQQQL